MLAPNQLATGIPVCIYKKSEQEDKTNEKNLSAKEKIQIQSTRFSGQNGYKKRQKSNR